MAMPSAIVGATGSTSIGVPAAIAAAIDAAPTASTPMIRVWGESARTAHAIPEMSPTAADGDEQGVEGRALLDELEPDCPLTSRDERIVEGGDVDRTPFRGEGGSEADAFIDALAAELDVSSVVAGRGDLRERRVLRHEDRRPEARQARGEGDPLRVVARGGSDDACIRSLLGDTRDPVVRAAQLERPRPLEVFWLEVHRSTDELGEGV